jgi:hypothetical protein
MQEEAPHSRTYTATEKGAPRATGIEALSWRTNRGNFRRTRVPSLLRGDSLPRLDGTVSIDALIAPPVDRRYRVSLQTERSQ